MSRWYKILLPTLFSILIGTILFSLSYSRIVDKELISMEDSTNVTRNVPMYHFFAVLPNSDEPYLKELVKGLVSAAAEEKAALEINYSSSTDEYSSTLKLLKIAISSKVNGIITKWYNTDEFQRIVDEATAKNIPIVSLDPNNAQNSKIAYVGTNGFEMGFKEGKLAAEAQKGKAHAKIAVILQGTDDYGNVKLEGIKDAIKNNKNIKIVTTKLSEPGILGAHNVTLDILNRFPDVDTIVCTTSKDTIGVAQLVVDFNRVEDISIIGFDSSPEILNYIQKEIIYGTIIPDFKSIGVKSIKFLTDVKRNGRASNYIDADSVVIKQNNIEKYMRETSQQGGASSND